MIAVAQQETRIHRQSHRPSFFPSQLYIRSSLSPIFNCNVNPFFKNVRHHQLHQQWVTGHVQGRP